MDKNFMIKQFNNNLNTLLDKKKSLDPEAIKDDEMLKFAQKLKSVDFSSDSSIEASLKKRLLLLMKKKEEMLEPDELSADQLDYVAGGVSSKGAEFNKNQLSMLINEDKDK